MIFEGKNKSDGSLTASTAAVGIEIGGASSGTLADTGIYDTLITEQTGILLVSEEANEYSAIFLIYDDGGTNVVKLQGATEITNTKDTVSSINVYNEAGSIKVQNSFGSDIEVVVKVIV